MATQNSVISYAPQPYFEDGTATIVANTNVSSIENTPGIFDPDLSNFSTVVPTSSAASFKAKIDFAKQSAHLTGADLTLGFIGCSLLTYEDSGGLPDLATEFSESIDCRMSANISAVTDELVSYAHNSQDTIHSFDREPLPSVISGGRANLIFTGLGKSNSGSTGTVYVTVERTAANVAARPHARFQIGHLFIGVDVPITIDPRSFSWTMVVENERFFARDFGAINSDGTLVKRSTGEITKIGQELLTGSTVSGVSPIVASVTPNLFDLIKVNTSYPLLLNPFPRAQVTEASLTVEEANFTTRQNFFSIYGFFSDPLEVQTDEYRDGLESQYRARFRFQETR
jgi:hypothetical protein